MSSQSVVERDEDTFWGKKGCSLSPIQVLLCLDLDSRTP